MSLAVARTGESTSLGGPDQLRKPADVKRWVLWMALALGVLVLAWMAWRLSREMAAATVTPAATDNAKASDARPD